MELTALDINLDPIAIIDIYESLIWTDRYNAYGDFELYTTVTEKLPNYIKQDYYLQVDDSEHVMIIEGISIKTDIEEGNHLTVSGRSLESILDRRIIWGRQSVDGNLQNGIKKILEDHVINPSDSSRRINNFVFEESTDPAITELNLDAQYTGNNLYELIHKVCSERNIGFKVTLNDNKQFVFKLYAGVDRSYDQTANPYVVFSPDFDNIVNSNYIESKSALKNIALIAGEGEGAARKFATVDKNSGIGLARRELFVDARDVSSDLGDGEVLSEDKYNAKLVQRGSEKLTDTVEVCSFEGQAETNIMYRYGEDFFDGDIVQVANEYGHSTAARILEIVRSVDNEGVSVYPTFETVQRGV